MVRVARAGRRLGQRGEGGEGGERGETMEGGEGGGLDAGEGYLSSDFKLASAVPISNADDRAGLSFSRI